MKRISFHGNDEGVLAGTVMVFAPLILLLIVSSWLWACALSRRADAYEAKFRNAIAEKNKEANAIYEID